MTAWAATTGVFGGRKHHVPSSQKGTPLAPRKNEAKTEVDLHKVATSRASHEVEVIKRREAEIARTTRAREPATTASTRSSGRVDARCDSLITLLTRCVRPRLEARRVVLEGATKRNRPSTPTSALCC